MKFYTKPWKHQREALKYLIDRDFGALYTDMGSGKTKIMIDLIANRGFKRVIVVTTAKACKRDVWHKEFGIHAPKLQKYVFNAFKYSSEKKVDKLKQINFKGNFEPIIMTINYESIWREPLKKYLLNNFKPDCVICDESHKIKSPSAKVSKFLQILGRKTPNRYLLTGTPLSQSPLDIYAQYRFLEPSIFGTRYDEFKDTYANWITMAEGYKILNKSRPYKNLGMLREKMFSCAYTCENLDLNLPPTQDIHIEFDLSSQATTYYKELKKEGCLELEKGFLETGNILGIILRLQQLTSGYIKLEDENKNKFYERVDTSRIEALKELIEGIPQDEPIVIFAKFRIDIKNIRDMLESIGIDSSEMSGKEDTTQDWVDNKTRVIVIQIASGAEGLNELVKSRYCIYYTLSHSLGMYLQSRKRLHRPRQTRPVIYYTLIAKNTIDKTILNSLKSNKNVVDYIMEKKKV